MAYYYFYYYYYFSSGVKQLPSRRVSSFLCAAVWDSPGGLHRTLDSLPKTGMELFCYHSDKQVPAELLVPWTFHPCGLESLGNSSPDSDRISWQAGLH